MYLFYMHMYYTVYMYTYMYIFRLLKVTGLYTVNGQWTDITLTASSVILHVPSKSSPTSGPSQS